MTLIEAYRRRRELNAEECLELRTQITHATKVLPFKRRTSEQRKKCVELEQLAREALRLRVISAAEYDAALKASR